MKSHHTFDGFNIFFCATLCFIKKTICAKLFHTQSIHVEYKIRVCLDEDWEKTDGITEILYWTCFYCTSKSGDEARTVTSLGGKIPKHWLTKMSVRLQETISYMKKKLTKGLYQTAVKTFLLKTISFDICVCVINICKINDIWKKSLFLSPHSVTETRRYRLFKWTIKYFDLIAENILSEYGLCVFSIIYVWKQLWRDWQRKNVVNNIDMAS